MDGCITFTVHHIHAYMYIVCGISYTHRINVHVRFSINNVSQDHTHRVIYKDKNNNIIRDYRVKGRGGRGWLWK